MGRYMSFCITFFFLLHTGLPPNADSVPTEVAIVCAMCQLAMTLEAQSNVTTKFTLKWSAQHCSTLVSRSEFAIN